MENAVEEDEIVEKSVEGILVKFAGEYVAREVGEGAARRWEELEERGVGDQWGRRKHSWNGQG